MKFKFGDLLYHIPTSDPYYAGVSVVQVLEYDSSRKKYKCVNFDTYIIYESFSIAYYNEEELDYLSNVMDEKELYVNGKPPFPKNIDDTYLNIYDVNDKEWKLIRKRIRTRKNIYELPLK